MAFSSDLKKAEQLWAATMKMATEIKKAGIEVDISKLKTSKMILSHCETDPHIHIEELIDAEEILNNARMELFIAAESLGQDFISRWENEFKKVMEGKSRYEFTVSNSKFVPGLPRDKNWVRIDISNILEFEKMREIVKSCGAKMEKQEGGYVLITGKKDFIKCVLDAISEVIKK